ncbi:MAG: hypothetical protein B7Y25_07835 [Alphaproteobacteria bacterium 16-39-46]|nr:MAG: hypothetical protein B7Y25_07835 [Alphaproteobacteria bacterium 16-39-46]OZA41430.1 MAG: hypothetical protein B7X84_07985 [Alphaproteobacteria bacterium 17-39-52]HQS83961.1 hypothetical protein [Alphaproteobacteria bacterium]HQS93807.1 hypothetical protein [Alphaproteobacteria bacterium]
MANVIQRGFFLGIVCVLGLSAESSVFGMKILVEASSALSAQNESPLSKDIFRIGKRGAVPRIKAQKSPSNYTLGSSDALQKRAIAFCDLGYWFVHWTPRAKRGLRPWIQGNTPIPHKGNIGDIELLYQTDDSSKPQITLKKETT